ncbi:hypothetical protein F2P81_025995 [Scophthalmus maximus]|uniref:Uncharacterized protein n=1 Tax=Scophthalmus maximus TaxID=52904 RepID=A0A6A4RRU6_SCOMX|nr:hypothetical protein F2P81_025995 [Scophthalmus maximus]
MTKGDKFASHEQNLTRNSTVQRKQSEYCMFVNRSTKQVERTCLWLFGSTVKCLSYRFSTLTVDDWVQLSNSYELELNVLTSSGAAGSYSEGSITDRNVQMFAGDRSHRAALQCCD